MVLTKNARLELDGELDKYRNCLKSVEDLLELINIFGAGRYPATKYPYQREKSDLPSLSEGGVFRDTYGSEAVDQYIAKNIDYFEDERNFYSLPRISKINELIENYERGKNKEDVKATLATSLKKIFESLKEVLVVGAEPFTVAGPLIDLVFEQEYVSQWMAKSSSDKQLQLRELTSEIVPRYDEYLTLIESLEGILGAEPESSKEGVLRVRFILALILGHTAKSDKLFEFLDPIKVRNGYPYTLQRQTFLSAKTLRLLLSSEIVLRNPAFGWDKKFVEAMRKERAPQGGTQGILGATSMPTNLGSRQQARSIPEDVSIDNLIQRLGTQIVGFVTFICAGLPGGKFEFNSTDKFESKDESKFCSWSPKSEKTHSVILLGSPGTGKSTVMVMGFSTFYNTIHAFGGTPSFNLPEDEALAKFLGQKFWQGDLPDPTNRGSRCSIKVSVEYPKSDIKMSHFVFTDIAGELVARSLTNEDSDPAVLRVLKNAETIVFFFDLSIEPFVRENLTKGDDQNFWKAIEDNYIRVHNKRREKGEGADVSQLQLLQRLISDLKDQKKGSTDLKETKFICVIPKIDLFTGQDDTNRRFFTNFFKVMSESQLLVNSRNHRAESFGGKTSLGGNGIRGEVEGIELQQKIGKLISNQAKECLFKIGDALGSEKDLKVHSDSLTQAIKVRLIDALEDAFGEENVYFLPVSATGEDTKENSLGHPPNQKFAEYVFALPVVLCN